jgi:uncharacterized membrane protein YoaK (UPF0700 family)
LAPVFQHEGPGRSELQNRILAGYLAFVGGFVNSAGFVLIGVFTSHVTGNVGRFSISAAHGEGTAAATTLLIVMSFMLGAFLASMAIESDVFGRSANGYAVALFGEAALLVVFTHTSSVTPPAYLRLLDVEGAILSCAMGMQNSLVTRLSGAVVRTTHLTGVLTDIGIEGARWLRWWRRSLSHATGLKLTFGKKAAERPAPLKVALLGTIAGTFVLGAALGAMAVVRMFHATMWIPSVALIAAGIYAILTGRVRTRMAATKDVRR